MTGSCLNAVANEWIRAPLVTDGGYGPVSGINHRVARQRVQLGANARQEQPSVAARKIISPNAAAKEHIAAQDQARLLTKYEHDMTGRVAWHIQNLEPNARSF